MQGPLCNMQIASDLACLPQRGKQEVPSETSEHVEQRLGEDPASLRAPAQVCQGVFVCVGGAGWCRVGDRVEGNGELQPKKQHWVERRGEEEVCLWLTWCLNPRFEEVEGP